MNMNVKTNPRTRTFSLPKPVPKVNVKAIKQATYVRAPSMYSRVRRNCAQLDFAVKPGCGCGK